MGEAAAQVVHDMMPSPSALTDEPRGDELGVRESGPRPARMVNLVPSQRR